MAKIDYLRKGKIVKGGIIKIDLFPLFSITKILDVKIDLNQS